MGWWGEGGRQWVGRGGRSQGVKGLRGSRCFILSYDISYDRELEGDTGPG